MNNKIKQLLKNAINLCNKRSVRLTPQRLKVLKIISLQKKAISAYDLLNILRESIPTAKPPTIYRALNFLLIQGFIHRVESTNKFMVCYNFKESSHNFTFLICDTCNQVIEKTTTKKIKKILKNIANTSGFKISYDIIESHGTCAKCYTITSSASSITTKYKTLI